jgi:hypothetical protein
VNIIKKYYPYFTGLAAFIVYLFTLAPSVTEIDTGELATVLATLGIAHPTGYPLFTMVGHLFTYIPLPVSVILKLNILAALYCASAVTVFVLSVKTILNNIESFSSVKTHPEIKGNKKEKKPASAQKTFNVKSLPEEIKILVSIFGGFILAFNRTFWEQSSSIEVYSLHLFLISLVILFLIKAFLFGNSDLKFSLKDRWLVFAFFLALAFSNHMTTLFIIPGIAYFYFSQNKFSVKGFKKIGLMLLVFFPVLALIYSYIPLRAAANPIMNWGNATDFDKLMRHVSAKQYQVWLFSSTEAAGKQFSHFMDALFGIYSGSAYDFGEFNLSLFIIVAGGIAAYKYAKKFWIFTVITFVFTVLYAINYNIVDIDTYFLLAFIMLAFLSVFGIIWLFEILKSERLNYAAPAGIIAVFIIIQCSINFRDTNCKDVYIFEDYTKAVLNSLDTNSIVLGYQWDYYMSPAFYFQNVENYRKDVTLIDKELLRRSWYFNQLERNHPGLIKKIQPDADVFLNALVPFEAGGNFDNVLLENSYRKIMTGLIATNIENKSVYLGPEMVENELQQGNFSLPEGYTIIPDLFLFKVVKQDSKYIPAKAPSFNIRFPYRLTKYTEAIQQFVGSMLTRRALYELQYNRVVKAKMYAAKLRKDFPDFVIPENISKAIGE